MKVAFWWGSVATALSFGTYGFAVSSQKYVWKNVKIGGGGGFVPGIVFNAKEKVCTSSLTHRQWTHDSLTMQSRDLPTLARTSAERIG